MNKREDILTKLSKKYLSKQHNNQHEESIEANYLKNLIEELYGHYKFIDLEKGSKIAAIFAELYMNKNQKLFYNLYFNNYISKDTFDRYRKRFDNAVLQLFKRDNITYYKEIETIRFIDKS